MYSKNRMIFPFILALGCLGSQNILADTVYQWTDETGSINFSDVPPVEPEITEMREFNINQPDKSNVDLEQYSIINQVEQMAAWRRQLADERLAKRQLYLEKRRLDQQLEIIRQNEAIAAESYIPRSYSYNPYRFHHHPSGIIPSSPINIQGTVTIPSRRNIIPRKYGPVHL